ncbi:MAG: hypothetical protein U0519_04750 [Candidatus Gracilibacteria bacterium]
MSNELRQKFEKLVDKVLDKRPVLREIIQKRGTKNLYEYAKDYINVNLNPPIQQRQDEMIGILQEEVERLLGKDVADSVATQLAAHYYVSTADHHGPVTHPFFINSNLLTAAPFFEHSDPALQNVIVLACGSVSLNNSSWPRGVLFNTCHKGKIETQRLSFFPAKDRLCPVFNYRPYTKEDIERCRGFLRDMIKDGSVHEEEGKKVDALLEEIYLTSSALDSRDFSEQVTKTNFHLWKKFFGPKYAQEAPNLIYLELESIVTKLLIKYHLYTDTVITHLLFDHAYDALVGKYFEGIQGAFDRKENYGTYLFWALPKGAKYRIQMWKEGDFLVTEDGSYKIELKPEIIQKALESKELMPSMMLSYMVLAFYYGLKCLGGFSQVNYLTFMKNAYIKMNVDRGNYRSIEVCARSQTKEMGGDFTLAFMGGPNGELVPSTGLDLILYGTDDTWPCLIEQSKQISLEEGIFTLMPEFYRILYLETERDPELLTVSAEDITKLLKLDEKVKACTNIKNHE